MRAERLSVSDHPGASRHPTCTRRGARARTVFRNLDSSFAKEGWLRHKENGPVPLLAQTGWLFKPPIIKKRVRSIRGGLKQHSLWLRPIGLARFAPPSAPVKGGFAAFFFMSRPPLL